MSSIRRLKRKRLDLVAPRDSKLVLCRGRQRVVPRPLRALCVGWKLYRIGKGRVLTVWPPSEGNPKPLRRVHLGRFTCHAISGRGDQSTRIRGLAHPGLRLLKVARNKH